MKILSSKEVIELQKLNEHYEILMQVMGLGDEVDLLTELYFLFLEYYSDERFNKVQNLLKELNLEVEAVTSLVEHKAIMITRII